MGISTDPFAFGATPFCALLFFGDLATTRIGLTKVIDTHKRVLDLVRQGAASADG